MSCLPAIALVLVLGPAAPLPEGSAAPLRAGPRVEGSAGALEVRGVAPLNGLRSPASAGALEIRGVAPLNGPAYAEGDGAVRVRAFAPLSAPVRGLAPADPGVAAVATPFGPGGPVPERPELDPRKLYVVRIEVLVGPVWRIRPGELMSVVGIEAGRVQGFSGAFHAGLLVAPDRDVVDVIDAPIGAGFVYRHRLGNSQLNASAGLSAGLLVHRAGTDRGVIHRVDPDFQLPLRLAWTVGEVGFSFVVLQGFNFRSRTYDRRGAEVWHRIPYRVGFAVGIHFDIGFARKQRRVRPV